MAIRIITQEIIVGTKKELIEYFKEFVKPASDLKEMEASMNNKTKQWFELKGSPIETQLNEVHNTVLYPMVFYLEYECANFDKTLSDSNPLNLTVIGKLVKMERPTIINKLKEIVSESDSDPQAPHSGRRDQMSDLKKQPEPSKVESDSPEEATRKVLGESSVVFLWQS